MSKLKLISLNILVLSSLITLPFVVNATAGGSVEAMQMPAWYERDGVKQPLKPGIKLSSGDIVSTGSSARLLIRLQEGSLVKLGENGVLNFDTILPPKQNDGIFAGLLKVAAGAFRFTTTKIGKNRKRDFKIKIGTVTAGIRGTDIWGRSNNGKDILCLIEGKITAQREGEPPFPMEDALSFYIAPKDKPALPVSPVPEAKLAKWAEETETHAGQGVLTIDGRWAVNVMSLQNYNAAGNLQQQLNNAGYATQVQKTVLNGQNWRRLRIEGFATREDAKNFATVINNQFGIQQPWIVKF